MLRRLIKRLRRMGFEGPYYAGALGTIRFVLESTLARTELIFVATAESLRERPASAPDIRLQTVTRYEDFSPFQSELETQYYPGYMESWRAPFSWGEQALVATIEGRLAGFAWLQFGTSAGFPTYYGRLLEKEVRILRVGVLPSFRRRGVNTAMLQQALADLFASGMRRVYIECYLRNVPSARAFLRAGFLPVGAIRVLEVPGLRGFVRWAPVAAALDIYRRVGMELPDSPAGEAPRDRADVAAVPAAAKVTA